MCLYTNESIVIIYCIPFLSYAAVHTCNSTLFKNESSFWPKKYQFSETKQNKTVVLTQLREKNAQKSFKWWVCRHFLHLHTPKKKLGLSPWKKRWSLDFDLCHKTLWWSTFFLSWRNLETTGLAWWKMEMEMMLPSCLTEVENDLSTLDLSVFSRSLVR